MSYERKLFDTVQFTHLHFLRTILHERYVYYQGLFYISIVCLFVIVSLVFVSWHKIGYGILWGALIGFFASMFAFLIEPVIVERSLSSIFIYGRASPRNLLISASLSLGWLVGIIYALVSVVLSKIGFINK
jgi:hypothetical protein